MAVISEFTRKNLHNCFVESAAAKTEIVRRWIDPRPLLAGAATGQLGLMPRVRGEPPAVREVTSFWSARWRCCATVGALRTLLGGEGKKRAVIEHDPHAPPRELRALTRRARKRRSTQHHTRIRRHGVAQHRPR